MIIIHAQPERNNARQQPTEAAQPAQQPAQNVAQPQALSNAQQQPQNDENANRQQGRVNNNPTPRHLAQCQTAQKWSDVSGCLCYRWGNRILSATPNAIVFSYFRLLPTTSTQMISAANRGLWQSNWCAQLWGSIRQDKESPCLHKGMLGPFTILCSY